MIDNKVVMQQALDALGLYLTAGHGNSTDFAKQGVAYDEAIESISTLGAAIAQQEQRTLLTETALCLLLVDIDPTTKRLPPGFKAFARAIETAHGISQQKDKP